jgi:phosphoglycerate dehydrogenase-like enzyme
VRAPSGEVVVCVGYPALLQPRYFERLRAVDARVRPIGLPIDADNDGSWVKVYPGDPHPEPPDWAHSVAAERRRALAEAQVLIALHTPAGLPELAPALRWIQGVGAGVEQFARAGVTRGQVIVTNASGLGSVSMAEFVIGRLLEIWKRFREIEEHQRERRYVQTYGRTFHGSTVGIVGMGAIGCAVAVRARALGARVLGVKRSEPSSEVAVLADRFFAPSALEEMLGECDAVVVTAPATPETRHLIGAQALAAVKRGCVLVNVSRGSLVDEVAVLEALADGRLGAAVLDVFEQEPLPPESPLWEAPGVYVSAHSSVSIDRYLDDLFDFFEENLGRYMRGEALRNGVDMEQLGFG